MIFWMKVCSRSRVSKYFCFVKRCVSSTLAIWAAVPAGFWDEDAQIWWTSEWISRRDVAIICGCDEHAYVAMIAASQGGWY